MHLVCPVTRSAAARMAQLGIVDALFLAVARITPQLRKRTFVALCRQSTTGTLVSYRATREEWNPSMESRAIEPGNVLMKQLPLRMSRKLQ
jgi:hypothetical protein